MSSLVVHHLREYRYRAHHCQLLLYVCTVQALDTAVFGNIGAVLGIDMNIQTVPTFLDRVVRTIYIFTVFSENETSIALSTAGGSPDDT